MSTIYHLRERLPRRRGNQFYKDRSVRIARTLCSASPTEYDHSFPPKTQKNLPADWNHPEKGLFTLCPACLLELEKLRTTE